MVERAQQLAACGNGILLETAGGLLSPWNGHQGAAELLVALGLPALVVAADVLGTQNHCLLTTEVLASRGIRLAGVVLVGRSADDSAWENSPALTELYGRQYLGRLPFLRKPNTEAVAQAVERHLAWPTLFENFR
jgi:dethiobiotin synthetase